MVFLRITILPTDQNYLIFLSIYNLKCYLTRLSEYLPHVIWNYSRFGQIINCLDYPLQLLDMYS